MPRLLPPFVRSSDRIVLFDGVCNLCNAGVQFILCHDHHAKLRLASVQSPPGQAMLAWCGLPIDRFDTMVFVEGGRAYYKSTAVLRIARHFSWPWPLLSLALAIPAWLRDWAYDRMARNRYAWFGKSETCWLPLPQWRARFLETTAEPPASSTGDHGGVPRADGTGARSSFS